MIGTSSRVMAMEHRILSKSYRQRLPGEPSQILRSAVVKLTGPVGRKLKSSMPHYDFDALF
jgi:hypothetical protein